MPQNKKNKKNKDASEKWEIAKPILLKCYHVRTRSGDRNFSVHRNPVHRNFSGPPESCAPETVLDFLFWVQLQTKKGFENFYIDESVCPFHQWVLRFSFFFLDFFS